MDALALVEIAAHAWRPAAEFGLLLEDPVFWGWGVPPGDGHAVLVLPGLFAGDRYLQPLRAGWGGSATAPSCRGSTATPAGPSPSFESWESSPSVSPGGQAGP